MTKYRDSLPQISKDLFLTDGGLETTMTFLKGFELPHFAAFPLLENQKGIQALEEYYKSYIDIALEKDVGFILDSPTWRASSDWAKKLGYSDESLADINRKAIKLLANIRERFENEKTMVISYCIGPRGDGYNAEKMMSEDEAQKYHEVQINTISQTEADMISAITITYSKEAIGIVHAAKRARMPITISFTVETDGRLPSGETLKEAIEKVDSASGNYPAYYMINCAHPTHFVNQLTKNEDWTRRIRGIRANASTKSHAELDQSDKLDEGNPVELGDHYRNLRKILTDLNVLGGCCGTDHRHIKEMCSYQE